MSRRNADSKEHGSCSIESFLVALEDYRNAVRHCREKIHVAKARLQHCEGQQKGLIKKILTPKERSEITLVP